MWGGKKHAPSSLIGKRCIVQRRNILQYCDHFGYLLKLHTRHLTFPHSSNLIYDIFCTVITFAQFIAITRPWFTIITVAQVKTITLAQLKAITLAQFSAIALAQFRATRLTNSQLSHLINYNNHTCSVHSNNTHSVHSSQSSETDHCTRTGCNDVNGSK